MTIADFQTAKRGFVACGAAVVKSALFLLLMK